MKRTYTSLLLPFLFLLALGVIMYFYFESYQSVKQLIGSNEELLNRINYKNKFQQLQTHLVTFDKLVREVVITKGDVEDDAIRNEIKLIDSTIAYIDSHLPANEADELGALLDSLVNLKIDDGINIHNEFVDYGKREAELMIYYQNKSNTNEKILSTIKDLEELSEQRVKVRINEIDLNERNAMRSNIMIAIGASLFLLITLIYIFNKIKQQQLLIQELSISKDKEKKASKIKDDFLANVSHEIRTPINAILGFTSLLEKESLTGKVEKFVSTIKTSGVYLMNIVNEILDIAKIEEGKIEIENKVFNLKDLIATIEHSYRDRIQLKGIAFQISYLPNEINTIVGDEYRLTQILNNLLSNSLKFTNQGIIKLEVRCKEINASSCVLIFTVSDTGIGITDEKMDKIFDRFEQGDTNITRKYGGTGLGLSIVKQLVELQYGLIHVKSTHGVGSEFTIELPFILFDKNKEIAGTTKADKKIHVQYPLHILIVEDNKINQQLLEYWFHEEQIEYKIAENGYEALALVSKNKFDLILMDIQMPEMDGYEVTHKIRSELKINVPIIAMTAHAMLSEKEKCIQAGMNDYLSKPISETELFFLITKNTVNQQNEPIINRDYLLKLSNGNKEFIQELLQQFLIQAPKELTMLQNSYQLRDEKALRAVAHSMKTTFGYFGIDKSMLNIFEEIEKELTMSEIECAIDKVRNLYKVVETDCNVLLNKYEEADV